MKKLQLFFYNIILFKSCDLQIYDTTFEIKNIISLEYNIY